MPVTLVITAGPSTGQSFTQTEAGPFVVGRAPIAHLQIPSGPEGDMRMSHTHFLIEYRPPWCELHDLNSHNGTYVNGVKVQTQQLQQGDQIRAGASLFRVELSGGPEEATVDAASPDLYQHLTQPVPTGQPYRQPTTAAPMETPDPASSLTETRSGCLTCGMPIPIEQEPICPACLQQATSRPQPIPEYLLLHELGRGSMGVVHLALHPRDRQLQAIKTILPSMTPRPGQVTRFVREADILKQLDHPNIVAFRELGTTPGGLLYLITDYIRGTDVGTLLKQRGSFKQRTALRIVCQMLQALEYAHDKGFVHRDIKPSNLLLQMVNHRHKIKLTDFGLARVYQASQLSGLTLSGEVGGTPAFIAPEQVMDYRNALPSADQYSAAATLYALLTGELLYDLRGNVSAMLGCVLNEDPVPILQRKPTLDVTLASIIQRALSRDPEAQFPHVRDLRAALIPFAR